MCAHAVRRIALALAVFATSVSAAMGQHRTWTDSTGKFSVEAELAEIKQDGVVLKRANGSTVTVPLARLSDADREYLKALPRPDAQLSRDAGTRAPLSFPDALTELPSWNDANTPFDLAAFLQAPPVEENAAPVYLEALIEFGKNEMDCLFPAMPEQEKWEGVLAAGKLSKEYQRLEDAWEKDPQSIDNAAVDAWLANYDVGFERLTAAQQRPKCVFQTGRSLSSLLPHNQVARQVARVVKWRTRRDIQRGDLERPLEDLKMQLRLNRDLQVRGSAVAQLVSIALDHQCCDLVRMILNAPRIEVQKCDQLLALLAEHEAKAIDAFLEGNRAEYIHCRQALHDLQHRTGDFDPQFMRDEWGIDGDVTSPVACIKLFTDLGGYSPQKLAEIVARQKGSLLPGAWRGGKMLSDEDYAREVDTLNHFFASILTLAEQPSFRTTRDVKAALAPLYKPLSETTLAGFLIPAEEPMFEAIRRGEASLRGTQCLVALKRWQLQHAGAPPDLLALVKAADLPRVPIDPYSDQPLRMGSVAGKTVIYSVGPDGKDDKAQVEWNLSRKQPGDFIFRLETPPQ